MVVSLGHSASDCQRQTYDGRKFGGFSRHELPFSSLCFYCLLLLLLQIDNADPAVFRGEWILWISRLGGTFTLCQ